MSAPASSEESGYQLFATNRFVGELVRLEVIEAKDLAERFLRWGRDSEFWRLMAGDPAGLYSLSPTVKYLEELQNEGVNQGGTNASLAIRRLSDDQVIGEIALEEIAWNHGDAFIGISIGERENWGKGYGTDAMRVLLRYAFMELNLHRVTLNVFVYNPRAIRSYEKCGFVEEGRQRDFLNRAGQRWDLVWMGLLREDWLRMEREKLE